MPNRLAGKRVVVSDATEYMGPGIVQLFQEEGAPVIADTRDLSATGRCAASIAEAGPVDVLMANLVGGNDRYGVIDTEDQSLDVLSARMVRPLHTLAWLILTTNLCHRRAPTFSQRSVDILSSQRQNATKNSHF